MFKIAFIGQKGIPISQGGVERHVEELSVRLANRGHEVFVYTRPHYVPKEYKKYEQVNLISLPSLNTKNLDAGIHTFISTLSAIFIQKVDVIHYQGIGPAFFAWLPKLLSRKIKVVFTFHSDDWTHQKWSSFAKAMLKLGARFGCMFSHKTIAVGRELQKYCLSKCKSETIYIPNGVADVSRGEEKNDKILDNFNLKNNKYILVISRLVKHKGIHYLIEAFKKLKQENPDTNIQDFKLVVVGSTAFTEDYQKFLLKMTKDRSDIIFTGTQTGAKLDTLLRHAYLYSQPSESEGLPIAVLEAMFYGKAVLVSNIAENLEVITGNSKTGTVGFDFENKNVSDLTNKLKLLINDPQIVYRVGKKAKEYVKFYYNWDEITDRTERVYKNIVLIKDKIPSKFKLALGKYIF